MKKKWKLLQQITASILCLSIYSTIQAHPLGDIISHQDKLYWVYVCPINNQSHQACIMRMDQDGTISEWQKSSHNASDYIVSRDSKNVLHFIERFFDHSKDAHQARMFALKGGQIESLTPWQMDTQRIGEAGFTLLPNGNTLFVSRGKFKVKMKDGTIKDWNKYSEQVQRFRVLKNGNLLLIAKKDVVTINLSGQVLQRWNNLIQPQEGSPPVMGNRIFDANFHQGELFIAYWGNRRFERIAKNGMRHVLKQYDAESPWLPHSIASHQGAVFALASHMVPNNILPEIVRFEGTQSKVAWHSSP